MLKEALELKDNVVKVTGNFFHDWKILCPLLVPLSFNTVNQNSTEILRLAEKRELGNNNLTKFPRDNKKALHAVVNCLISFVKRATESNTSSLNGLF